jgi:hypothetical protein
VIGQFSKNKTGVVLLLLLVGVLLKIPFLYKAAPVIVSPGDGILFTKFIDWIRPVGDIIPGIYNVLAIFLIFLQANILTRFINNNHLMSRTNYLPALAYFLITSLLPGFNQLSSQLIVATLLLLIFMQIFRTYGRESQFGPIFSSGVLLGLAALLYFPSLVFFFWLLVALAVLRPFRPNEWLLAVLGVLTPYYFLFAYFFLTDQIDQFRILEPLILGVPLQKATLRVAGTVFLLLLPLLTGIYYAQSLSGKMLIHVRKAWILFGWYAIMGILMMFFFPSENYSNWVCLLLPVASFHGFGYLNTEIRVYPPVAFWLSVVLIVVSVIFSPAI